MQGQCNKPKNQNTLIPSLNASLTKNSDDDNITVWIRGETCTLREYKVKHGYPILLNNMDAMKLLYETEKPMYASQMASMLNVHVRAITETMGKLRNMGFAVGFSRGRRGKYYLLTPLGAEQYKRAIESGDAERVLATN